MQGLHLQGRFIYNVLLWGKVYRTLPVALCVLQKERGDLLFCIPSTSSSRGLHSQTQSSLAPPQQFLSSVPLYQLVPTTYLYRILSKIPIELLLEQGEERARLVLKILKKETQNFRQMGFKKSDIGLKYERILCNYIFNPEDPIAKLPKEKKKAQDPEKFQAKRKAEPVNPPSPPKKPSLEMPEPVTIIEEDPPSAPKLSSQTEIKEESKIIDLKGNSLMDMLKRKIVVPAEVKESLVDDKRISLKFHGTSVPQIKQKDKETAEFIKTIFETDCEWKVKAEKILQHLKGREDLHKLQIECTLTDRDNYRNDLAIAAVLAKVMKLPKLKFKNVVGHEALLASALKTLPCISRLDTLSFEGMTVHLPIEVFAYLKVNGTMTSLRFSCCELPFFYGTEGGNIAAIFKRGKTLKALKIKKCGLLDQDMDVIKQCLEENYNLRILDLSENGITLAGMKKILESCKKNTTLDTLILRGTLASLSDMDHDTAHMLDERKQPLNAYIDQFYYPMLFVLVYLNIECERYYINNNSNVKRTAQPNIQDACQNPAQGRRLLWRRQGCYNKRLECNAEESSQQRSEEENKSENELLDIGIDLGDGKEEHILVYEGDNAQDVADTFCLKHKLDPRQKAILVDQIKKAMEDELRNRTPNPTQNIYNETISENVDEDDSSEHHVSIGAKIPVLGARLSNRTGGTGYTANSRKSDPIKPPTKKPEQENWESIVGTKLRQKVSKPVSTAKNTTAQASTKYPSTIHTARQPTAAPSPPIQCVELSPSQSSDLISLENRFKRGNSVGDIGRGVSLYERGIKKKAMHARIAKEKINERRIKEMEGVTFKPSINSSAKSIKSYIKKKPEERLMCHLKVVQEKQEKIKHDVSKEWEAKHPFHPTINKRQIYSQQNPIEVC
eukprot:TRINITY_DN145_c0_g1_i2.p1 TRINITY_DN145_c0_g1~~TRINITY_DN145_c0_g1_i2.p1  ORF type:complete len:898 (+),score=107.33 TRINITY_DN145_c0_g1_i2:782-3475(+)